MCRMLFTVSSAKGYMAAKEHSIFIFFRFYLQMTASKYSNYIIKYQTYLYICICMYEGKTGLSRLHFVLPKV